VSRRGADEDSETNGESMTTKKLLRAVPAGQSTSAKQKKRLSPRELISGHGILSAAVQAQHPELFLEESFIYDGGARARLHDTRKAILSAAYLLEWCADSGGDPPLQAAVKGLSDVLRRAASDVANLFTQDDVRDAGGDPSRIIARRYSLHDRNRESES
jgi:hypothetical protein